MKKYSGHMTRKAISGETGPPAPGTWWMQVRKRKSHRCKRWFSGEDEEDGSVRNRTGKVTRGTCFGGEKTNIFSFNLKYLPAPSKDVWQIVGVSLLDLKIWLTV